MKVISQFEIHANISDVWSVFMDPVKLASCVPGCKKIKALSQTTYEALVEVKAQFVPIKIRAIGELKEAVENRKLVVEMHGKPVSFKGSFTNRLVVHLSEFSENMTLVSYEMDIQVTGKLAAIGELLMKGSSSKNSEEFVKNVQDLFQHS